MKLFKPFYIQNRFFYACITLMIMFVFSFVFPRWFVIVQLLFLVLLVFTILDIILLFSTKKGVNGLRILQEKFSNGDQNPIQLSIENYYTFPILIKIIDEIPVQFQVRNFNIERKLDATSKTDLQYELRPTEKNFPRNL